VLCQGFTASGVNACTTIVQETLLGPEELMEVLSVLWEQFEEVCVKQNVQRCHAPPSTLLPHLSSHARAVAPPPSPPLTCP